MGVFIPISQAGELSTERLNAIAPVAWGGRWQSRGQAADLRQPWTCSGQRADTRVHMSVPIIIVCVPAGPVSFGSPGKTRSQGSPTSPKGQNKPGQGAVTD